MNAVAGLHHVTAVAREPQRNIDFYQQVLGQRLVKTTVNFDDPGTYHLYYGDYLGSPGTALTFFPWQHLKPGRIGNGETTALAYQIPLNAVGFWRARLSAYGFTPGREETRFDTEVLPFTDPEGMRLELIPKDEPDLITVWEQGPVDEQVAVRGFDGVTLWVAEIESTASILDEVLGYRFAGQEENRYRYELSGSAPGRVVDLVHRPAGDIGRFGGGTIHHIAFRARDDQHQESIRQAVLKRGVIATQMIDRQYFRSVYFRTPAGVLFEIATDDPGFMYDESAESLGQELKLPPWFENQREIIESALPKINRNFYREPVHE